MDALYLCRPGDNEELRYSMRSLKNMPHDRVWFFGSAPAWVTGATTVETPQNRSKYINAENSLRVAIEHEGVSETFVLMNDDFFVVEPLDEIPTLHRGPVSELLAWHESKYPDACYTAVMRDTLEVCRRLGIKEPLSYELHIPMVLTKSGMREVMSICDSHPRPLQYRTIYGNLNNIGGHLAEDVKVYQFDRPRRGQFLSTDDCSFKHVQPILDYLLGEPCEYEAQDVPESSERVITEQRLYDTDGAGGRFLAYAVGELVPIGEYERLMARH